MAGRLTSATAQRSAGLNDGDAADDGHVVGPGDRAFFEAVLLHVAISHRAGPRELTELAALEHQLGSASAVCPDDRRRHRRCPIELDALARTGDTVAPARVLDLGAGGLRLRNDGRLPVAVGDRMVVSLLPEHAPIRIDVPVEVMRTGADELGLRFCGAPLVLRGRPAVSAAAGCGTVSMRAVA